MNRTIEPNTYGVLKNILFIDIETVPEYPSFETLPEPFKKCWLSKAARLKSDEGQTPEEMYSRAGIYSEFGRIICISAGYIVENKFRVRSFYDESERELLSKFGNMLSGLFPKGLWKLCAHNGKEFDFPYIARRMLINNIRLPDMLDMGTKKPWEVPHLDTMEMWKFGDYKNYASLDLLCAVFGIQTPKDDIDGSMVAKVYYEEKDLERIVAYCLKDTFAVASLLMKYKGLPLLPEENIFFLQ